MKNRVVLDTFRIAATYIGTIIGAGFASGQELMQFFVAHGSSGIIGIMLAGIMFIGLGGRIIELGHKLKASGYHQLLEYVCGTRIGRLVDIIISLSLFGAVSIMLAGAGAIGHSYFNLPNEIGILAMSITLTATALGGIDRVVAANMILTPLLTAFIVAIGVSSICYHGIDWNILRLPARPAAAPTPWWPLSSILYVAYNLAMGTAILAPLGASIASRRARVNGCLLGGLTLAVLSILATITLMLHLSLAWDNEIPMLQISALQHDLSSTVYSVIMLAAMYTTALACLYGCAAKAEAVTSLSFNWCLIVLSLASITLSQLGFSQLIAALYPLSGYAALLFILKLMVVKI